MTTCHKLVVDPNYISMITTYHKLVVDGYYITRKITIVDQSLEANEKVGEWHPDLEREECQFWN
jgi:hypothetical protein